MKPFKLQNMDLPITSIPQKKKKKKNLEILGKPSVSV